MATSRKTRGGITSVIKAHETGEQWRRFHCHWVQTHRDGPAWRKLVYFLIGFCDFIFRIPFYDIVHFHVSLATTIKRKKPLFKLAKFLKKKTIVHLHCGTQIDESWNSDYQYFFTNCDQIIVLSECLKKIIQGKMGLSHNITVLYNPCPKLYNLSLVKENIILFSGTLYKGKGYQDLINAFALIATKYPDWKVVFAGNGEIAEGEALAKSLGIEKQTEFTGWISGEEKDSLFRKARIFCLPSYAEGFPMAVLDAWAYGLPVITTPVGGIPDVAENGENMLLFTPGDVVRLSQQLEKLIGDPELWEKISVHSRDFAMNQFNISTINKQLGDIYTHITE